MFNFGEEVSGDTPLSGLIFETRFSLSVLSFFNNLSLLFKLDLLLFSRIWLFSVRASSLLLVKISALILSLVNAGSPLAFSANFCSWWFPLTELQEHWQLFRLNSPSIIFCLSLSWFFKLLIWCFSDWITTCTKVSLPSSTVFVEESLYVIIWNGLPVVISYSVISSKLICNSALTLVDISIMKQNYFEHFKISHLPLIPKYFRYFLKFPYFLRW